MDSARKHFGTALTLLFLFGAFLYNSSLLHNKSLFKDQILFIANISFMNTVHIIFTFLGLAFIKEAREWTSEFIRSDRMLPFFICASFLLFGAIYIIDDGGWAWRMSRLGIRLYGIYHAALQSYGLFALNNPSIHSLKLKPYFAGLALLFGISLCFYEFASVGSKTLGTFTCAGLSGLLLIVLVLKVRNAKHESSFLTRMILYPVGILNPIAGYGISAIHGTEYALLFNKMTKTSVSRVKLQSGSLQTWALYALFLGFTACCLLLFREGVFSIEAVVEKPTTLLLGIWLLVDVLNVVHFYIDARMFRHTSPNSRKHILPLIRDTRIPGARHGLP